MKIKSVVLKDFKRFTALTVQDLPATARLVVLVGPNGSGKTSLFEAFNVLLQRMKGGLFLDADYHLKVSPQFDMESKNQAGGYFLFEQNKVKVEFHDRAEFQWNSPTEGDKESFYIRSSHRHEADFTVTALQRQGNILDDPNRPQTMMASETRVSFNYQNLVANTLEAIYSGQHDNQKVMELREELIGEIGESLERVLPGLKLRGPGHPMRDGTFFFDKNAALDWKYKNLSGGEKAAFDLILDFVIKSGYFRNTVYCIDEPEVHMHTSVQAVLLTELLRKLPTQSQLWVATHSAAMLRAARDLYHECPGEVVFLDFGGHNFDEPVIMQPAIPDRAFWKRNFEVALGDIANLVAPSRIVFCEGTPNAQGKGFDAKCYDIIFADEFPDTEFVSLGGSNEVGMNAIKVMSIVEQVLQSVQFVKLRDRDDHSAEGVEEMCAQDSTLHILSRREIENYLWDDEILLRLCRQRGQEEKVERVREIVRVALESSTSQERGNAPDDVKKASGDIFVHIKKELGLHNMGNNAEQFAQRVLAPLVTPDTKTYQTLKDDIFGVQK